MTDSDGRRCEKPCRSFPAGIPNNEVIKAAKVYEYSLAFLQEAVDLVAKLGWQTQEWRGSLADGLALVNVEGRKRRRSRPGETMRRFRVPLSRSAGHLEFSGAEPGWSRGAWYTWEWGCSLWLWGQGFWRMWGRVHGERRLALT